MTLLEAAHLKTAYGAVVVNRDVSLTVGEHEIVTILGANGAGKSTLLRAISGLLRPKAGTIRFDGKDVTGLPADRMAGLGVVAVEADIARMESYFEILATKRGAKGGQLSGGQQQMLAIARGLMARPRVLLLDEPSLGLAPVMVKEVRSVIAEIRDVFGASVLLVEQNAGLALAVAERGYLLQHGEIVATGTIAALRDDHLMRELYLGEGRARQTAALGEVIAGA